ncbi:unnamed protein product [Closterium sp. Naga37s-1]|nr:unnamed protein product [Closterium sp. Naga37s-1]
MPMVGGMTLKVLVDAMLAKPDGYYASFATLAFESGAARGQFQSDPLPPPPKDKKGGKDGGKKGGKDGGKNGGGKNGGDQFGTLVGVVAARVNGSNVDLQGDVNATGCIDLAVFLNATTNDYDIRYHVRVSLNDSGEPIGVVIKKGADVALTVLTSDATWTNRTLSDAERAKLGGKLTPKGKKGKQPPPPPPPPLGYNYETSGTWLSASTLTADNGQTYKELVDAMLAAPDAYSAFIYTSSFQAGAAKGAFANVTKDGERSGHGTNYGAAGEGAVDVQTQAFRTHQRSRKHKRSVKRQALAEQAAEKQQRIIDCPKAGDIQRFGTLQSDRHQASPRMATVLITPDVTVLCSIVSSWTDSNGPQKQSRQSLPPQTHLPFSPCYPPFSPGHIMLCREALAAKDAATAVPELGLIDYMLKELAEYLGRSHPSHNEFKELQEVFCQTNLELQGIHAVRWLSRGDAITRLVRVLPAVIVLMWEWDDDFYPIVTSVKFNVYLYYLADMLLILNNLNLEFQKREVDMTSVQSTVRRTLITIRTRYIECGNDFGGGPQQHLGAFLARLRKSPKVTVDGVDKEGRPRKHSFELHEEPLTGYSKTPDDLQSCLDVCRRHAKSTLSHLQRRLGDLESLNGFRLFMLDTYPEDTEGRAEECLEHFETLVDLFHARERADILPVVDLWRSSKKRRPIRRREKQRHRPVSAAGKGNVLEDGQEADTEHGSSSSNDSGFSSSSEDDDE